MSRSLSASPNTQTSSSARPRIFCNMATPSALPQPFGLASSQFTTVLGNDSPGHASESTRESSTARSLSPITTIPAFTTG